MDPAEICTGDLTHQVLVIQLPRGDRGEADLTAYRDYVVASLAQGVLVLGSGTIWAVEELPGLGGVQIQRDAGILRAHSVPGPKPEPQPATAKPVAGEEGDPGTAPAVPSGGRPGLSGGGVQPVRRRSHGGQAPGRPHRSGKTAH